MAAIYKFNSGGILTFGKPATSKLSEPVKMHFHPLAFAKMALLIEKQSKEVAWHGLIVRKEPYVYEIEDVLVYPQVVSGVTVNTDQVPYQSWLMGHDNDVFGKIRMQGHSHVNMGTNPSGVDMKHQSGIVTQLEGDMFYVFMIWNKSFKCQTFVYDVREKLVYYGDDILIDVLSTKLHPTGFTFEQKKVLKLVKHLYPQIAGFYGDAVKLIRDPSAPVGEEDKKPSFGFRRSCIGRFFAGN